ncbi:protein of unknown function [Rhodovastum atsumiense]|nr:protein of unknown function [Rhodovastum atsumiense]
MRWRRAPSHTAIRANRIGTLPQDRYRAALAGFDNLLRLLAVSKAEQPWAATFVACSVGSVANP